MELTRLSLQNPWWSGAGALSEDPHLERFQAAPVKLVHECESAVHLDAEGIYVLRGPRQIGKSTLLKRMVKSRVEAGVAPTDIMYLALDIADIRTHVDLADAIRLFVELRSRSARRYVFLDEVTHCREWALGLKAAFDLGSLRRCLVICTGSHNLDLRKGSEKLPGRRGSVEAESDLEMGPFSFHAIAAVRDPEVTAARASTWKPSDVYDAARENTVRYRHAAESFTTFLLGGGMPRAVGEVFRHDRFSRDTGAAHVAAVVGDLLRAGKKESFVRDLVRGVVELHGGPADWHGLAERVSIGSKTTVSDYVEAMKACYLLVVLPQPATLGARAGAPRKGRKLHFRDPFLRHIFTGWATGIPDPWDAAVACLGDSRSAGLLVEGAIAGQVLPLFSELMYWRNSSEIDMIGIPPSSGQVLIEVKYQSRVTSSDTRALRRLGGGFVVSRQSLSYDKETNVAAIPAHTFLLSVPGADRRG